MIYAQFQIKISIGGKLTVVFLQKIDKLFEESRAQYSVSSQNDDFHTYIPIEIFNSTNRFQFLIRKGKKSKILIISGNQKVYLTDYQIIKTILSMEDMEIEWFLEQFISLFTGNGAQIKFILEGAEFTYEGIPSYPEEKTVMLVSDTSIDLSYFCFLLNFIFAKDMCWEELSSIPNFGKKTLCKFISIIDYCHNASEYSKLFLKELGYPLNLPQPSNHINARKAFEKNDCIEIFDISNYL